MPTYLEGVLLDLSTSPPSPAGGFVVKAYSTILGTYSGSAVTDGKGRFQIISLPDRDDWVPVSQGPPQTVAVLEHIDLPALQGMMSGRLLTVGQLEASGYVTADGEFLNYLDNYDMIVDQDYQGSSPTVKPTLAEAIAAGGVSIFVRNAGDTVPATIAQGNAAQRIQGKDADTTLLPVSVTLNKSSETIEQLALTNVTLTLGAIDPFTLKDLLLSGSAQITNGVAAATNGLIERIRSTGMSAIAVLLDENCAQTTSAGFRGSFGVVTAPSILSIAGYQQALVDARILGVGTTDYALVSGGQELEDSQIIGGIIRAGQNGGANLTCDGVHIDAVHFQVHQALLSGKRLLRLTSAAGVDITSRVENCSLIGNALDHAAAALFECASADADAAGLLMVGNTFRTGTVLFSQDSMWEGNDFAGCTLNFQSKTGIVIIGGDMTGVTLQNIPTDIVFRNVKGQEDRGPFGIDTQPVCHIYRNSDQSIPNAAVTAILFDSEGYDSDGMHSTVTNTDRITFQRAGKYRLWTTIIWDTSALGFRIVRWELNGTTTLSEQRLPPVTGSNTTMECSYEDAFAAGDYVRVVVYQDTGAALLVKSNFLGLYARAMASRISP